MHPDLAGSEARQKRLVTSLNFPFPFDFYIISFFPVFIPYVISDTNDMRPDEVSEGNGIAGRGKGGKEDGRGSEKEE